MCGIDLCVLLIASNYEVEYEAGMRKSEDVNLCMQVLRKGGLVCKSQRFAYRASHKRNGGCDTDRYDEKASTTLAELVETAHYELIPCWRQSILLDMVAAVRGQEKHSEQVAKGLKRPRDKHLVQL